MVIDQIHKTPPGQGTVPTELDYGSVLQLIFDKPI